MRICAGSDHAKFAELRQFSPMEACFLVLEPHFCCQISLCKLRQILATHTSHLRAQVHGAALMPSSLLTFSTKAKLPTAAASDHREQSSKVRSCNDTFRFFHLANTSTQRGQTLT